MDKSLVLLAREVRGKTLKLLDGVREEEARFAASGLNNSILWHAGHAFVVVESICFTRDTGRQPSVPDGWFDTFSWTSRPAEITAWPPLEEVVGRLKEQLSRVVELIAGLSPEHLARKGSYWPTVRFGILHALHDEANHQGEVWLLRKMLSRGVAK